MGFFNRNREKRTSLDTLDELSGGKVRQAIKQVGLARARYQRGKHQLIKLGGTTLYIIRQREKIAQEIQQNIKNTVDSIRRDIDKTVDQLPPEVQGFIRRRKNAS